MPREGSFVIKIKINILFDKYRIPLEWNHGQKLLNNNSNTDNDDDTNIEAN